MPDIFGLSALVIGCIASVILIAVVGGIIIVAAANDRWKNR